MGSTCSLERGEQVTGDNGEQVQSGARGAENAKGARQVEIKSKGRKSRQSKECRGRGGS
jgi:hypothetical protein